VKRQTPKIYLDLIDTPKKIDRKKIRILIKKILFYFLPEAKAVYLSIFFVNEKEITYLNKKFRKKPCTKTVLSFPQDEPLKKKRINERIVLGDIFLSFPKTNSHSREIYFYLWHGLLHLLGLSHREMEKYNGLWEKLKKSLH